jgi:hypothetical protein
MIYFLAIILSLVAALMSFASEITAGNIGHLENGREPNAGAAILPTIPFLPLLAVGFASLLRVFIPERATSILFGVFLLFVFLWSISFVRLRFRFRRLNAMHRQPKQSGANVP